MEEEIVDESIAANKTDEMETNNVNPVEDVEDMKDDDVKPGATEGMKTEKVTKDDDVKPVATEGMKTDVGKEAKGVDVKTEVVEEEEITLQSMGGATYKVLTKEEAMNVDPSLLHKMIRPNNTKCFTLKNGDETKQVEKKGFLSSLNPFNKKGGKLKTKKNRKTKKRNQKKGFKSRSKK